MRESLGCFAHLPGGRGGMRGCRGYFAAEPFMQTLRTSGFWLNT